MRNRKVFLKILNNYMHPSKAAAVDESLSGDEWSELLTLASAHAILPIVYEAVWNNASFARQVPQELQQRVKMNVRLQVMKQLQTTDYFLRLYRGMAKRNITPLVMKGIVCRNMYTMPDNRLSGDEDMLISKTDFPILDRFLQEQGFSREELQNILECHEIAYFHRGNGMRLEVHLSLFPFESEAYGRLNQEFPSVFERHSNVMIQGTEVATLDETQHMLYLLCHGLKHFLHTGFGIRQLCDMVMFAETYGEQIDWNEIVQRTKNQNMYIFWMNLFDIGEHYLGFSWEKAGLKRPKSKILDSDNMLEDILRGGVYGTSSYGRMHSANFTLQAVENEKKSGTGILRSLFPSVDYMSKRYEYVKRNKLFLPVAYIRRILTYRKQMDGKTVTSAIEIGKQRVELLKQYGIIKK